MREGGRKLIVREKDIDLQERVHRTADSASELQIP